MRAIRIHLLFFAVIFCLGSSSAATFESLATGNWNVAGTWTVTAGADANNIPDSDDDVTIRDGHIITLTNTSYCNDLTIDGPSGRLTKNNRTLNIYGNLDNNGVFQGGGVIRFYGAGKSITSASTLVNPHDWEFRGSTTISAGTVISKNNYFRIYGSVTNLGTVQLNTETVYFRYATSVWTNGAGSFLAVRNSFLGSASGTLNASAIGNTVVYNYRSVYSSLQIKSPSGGNYYNLNLQGGGIKIAQGNFTVNNDFVLGSAGTFTTFNANGKDITFSGSFTADGDTPTITGNTGTMTFNGAAAQSVDAPLEDLTCNNLVIDNAAGVTFTMPVDITGTTTLTSGTLTTSSTLTFDGAAAQTIGGAGTLACSSTGTVTVNNVLGVTSSVSMTIDGTIVVDAGTFDTGAGAVTVTSTAGNTGRIGNSAGTIAGTNWRIQRHIPAGNANWADMSSPINGTVLTDWDNELYMSIAAACPDGLAGNFRSVRQFNVVTQAYGNITTCAAPLTTAKGYKVWLATTMTVMSETTMDTRGTPNFGDKAATLADAAGEWSLIGNPYASGVDWDLLYADATNLTNAFQVFDDVSNDYLTLGSGDVISCTQGLWVQNSGAVPTLTFKESHKSATNAAFIRQAKPLEENVLKMHLHSTALTNSCDAYIHINDNGQDHFNPVTDISFRRSPDTLTPSMNPISTDGILTRIKHIPVKSSYSIPVVIQTYKEGEYTIDFDGLRSIYNYNCIIMEDESSGKSIKLNPGSTYSFFQSDISQARKLMLHFVNICSSPDQFANSVQVFSTTDGIKANFSFTETTPVEVSIFNTLGQVVMTENLQVASDAVTFPLYKDSQVYFVRVTTTNGTTTYKVLH